MRAISAVCKTGRGDPVTPALSPERPALRNGLCLGQDVLPRRFFRFYRRPAANSSARSCRRRIITLTLHTGMTESSLSSPRQQQTARDAEKARRAPPRPRARWSTIAESTRIARRTSQRWLSVPLFPWWRSRDEEDAPHIFTHQLRKHRGRSAAFAAAYVRRLMQSGVALPRDHRRRDRLRPPICLFCALSFIARGYPGLFCRRRRRSSRVPRSPRCAARCMRRSGMNTSPVVNYLKSPLSPLMREAADQLERYAFRWNLHGACLGTGADCSIRAASASRGRMRIVK